MDEKLQKAQEQASLIKPMNEMAQLLDIEYLESALKEMKDNHSWRDAAMVLNPHPLTHSARQKLDQAKLSQLELMIALAKNCVLIRNLTMSFIDAKVNEEKLDDLFK